MSNRGARPNTKFVYIVQTLPFLEVSTLKKNILCILFITIILTSGCVSDKKPIEPVGPDEINVEIAPIIIKEFKEQPISVSILNNATESIDSVTVTSLGLFSVLESTNVNIPGKKDVPIGIIINAQIKAPGFKSDTANSTLTISYASGRDTKGNPIISTKSVPVQVTILPDAKLETVGFVKDMQNLLDPRMAEWELHKGENVTISFHTRNEGQTTIDENTLIVSYDVENKRIGGNGTLIIPEAMAKAGTSYTRGLEVPILGDAPNGDTNVYLTLSMNDHIIDTQTLVLKVIL